MKESKIETHLRKRIEALGGLCYKFVSPGRRNVPDRIVLLPGVTTIPPTRIWDTAPRTIFVELKAPGKKPTPGQLREHERLRGLGFRVEVLDSIRAVEDFVDGL